MSPLQNIFPIFTAAFRIPLQGAALCIAVSKAERLQERQKSPRKKLPSSCFYTGLVAQRFAGSFSLQNPAVCKVELTLRIITTTEAPTISFVFHPLITSSYCPGVSHSHTSKLVQLQLAKM